jgi:hypothetical protein
LEVHHDFLGTLENIEYSYEVSNLLTESKKIIIERHFKPIQEKDITLKDIQVVKKLDKDIQVIKKNIKVDDNLYSPYFTDQ